MTIPSEVYVLFGTLLGGLLTLLNQRLQIQAENRAQKWQAEQEKEDRLREKLESAHLLLSKIVDENSLAASYIREAASMTAEAYDALHQKSREDVRTLQMITDLYCPELHAGIEELAGVTVEYWQSQEVLLSKQSTEARGQVADFSSKIASQVADAKQRLRHLAGALNVRPAKINEPPGWRARFGF